MHPRVQSTLTDLIRRWPPPGPRVLELGANYWTAVAFRDVLEGCEYLGINFDPVQGERDLGIVAGNANDMRKFADQSVDAVITNAMLEHDRAFWLTMSEVRRVLKPGGRVYLGVPGFQAGRRDRAVMRWQQRYNERFHDGRRLGRNRVIRGLSERVIERAITTATYPIHGAPDDFWRFSPSAVREVLMNGFEVREQTSVMVPPRLLAVGDLVR